MLAVIPAYNEGQRTGGVVRGARKYLPVLVVDDGSTDDTAERAGAAGAVVLKQEQNRGKGEALKAGFRYALEHGYAAVITLDADGQHDPDEIPKFLDVYEKTSPELVIGYRDFKQMPPARRAANTAGTLLFSWAVGKRIRDNQSGYRLISASLLQALLQVEESGFEFEVDMIVRCLTDGCRLDWVPIRTIYAGEKSHIKPIRHIINFLRVALAARGAMRTAGRR